MAPRGAWPWAASFEGASEANGTFAAHELDPFQEKNASAGVPRPLERRKSLVMDSPAFCLY